jgi:hypothetical protein
MTIYGLLGITHGWGRLLTVMSPEGTAAVGAAVAAGDGIETKAADGRLIQYHEIKAGALQRLIATHGIVVLSKADWDAKKQELGDRVW